MIPKLTAVLLHKVLSSGRCKPVLFGCVNEGGENAGDYVVKLTSVMDTGVRGAASELVASLLAAHFGISHPAPASVRIHPDLRAFVSAKRPDLAKFMSMASGLNFGSRQLTDVSTWPSGKDLPASMQLAALNIFAFDALLSNDDRRYNNPNLLIRGDEVFAIDHEAAFSFLYLVGKLEKPWEVGRRQSLNDHAFYYQLRKQPLDLGLFTSRLAQLSDERLEQLVEKLPLEWRIPDLGRISTHLRSIRERASDFERQILEKLA